MSDFCGYTECVGCIAEAGHDLTTHFTIHTVYWHYERTSNELLVRVSSLGTFFACTIEVIDSVLHCTLQTKVRGVASGQSAVFYDGDFVIGGGIIQEDPLPS